MFLSEIFSMTDYDGNQKASKKHKPASNSDTPQTDAPGSAGNILHLQRTIGNQAVQRLINSGSPALKIRQSLQRQPDVQRVPGEELEEKAANAGTNAPAAANTADANVPAAPNPAPGANPAANAAPDVESKMPNDDLESKMPVQEAQPAVQEQQAAAQQAPAGNPQLEDEKV
jgi:hypothetical protein